jgi:hypothetical protein
MPTHWMRLGQTFRHPRFARLERVEIILDTFNLLPKLADVWVRRVRAGMGVFDSRGCLFVSVF